jgi:hypothetical protein
MNYHYINSLFLTKHFQNIDNSNLDGFPLPPLLSSIKYPSYHFLKNFSIYLKLKFSSIFQQILFPN